MDGDEDEESEEIDVQSEKFNPLSALYSKKLIVPFPSAPVLDNVAKANSLLSRNLNLVNEVRGPVKLISTEEKASTSKENVGVVLNQGISGWRKTSKNVLTRMAETKGPLAFLRTCMDKRLRVKVWTRSAGEIRGYCLGFVVAFDKHWNLALEDVQEVWSRPIKRKKFLLGEANEMPLAWKAMGPAVKPPKVVVTRGKGGKETCERHVGQMLMRGEQIVFISVASV